MLTEAHPMSLTLTKKAAAQLANTGIPPYSLKAASTFLFDYKAEGLKKREALDLIRAEANRIYEIRLNRKASRPKPPMSLKDRLTKFVLRKYEDSRRFALTQLQKASPVRSRSDTTEYDVTIGGPGALNSVKVEILAGRSYCSGGFWHRTNPLQVTANLSKDWKVSVYDKGLSIVDGLFTTSAALVHTDENISVYKASWVESGTGYSVRKVNGFIAISGSVAYHSTKDVKAAIRGLRRKISIQATPQSVRDERARKRAEARERAVQRLAERLQKYDLAEVGDVVVTRQDSLKAGNCVPGTDEFIARFAPGRASATIAEIVDSMRLQSVTVAKLATETLGRQFIAACLMAIRRSRKAKLKEALSGP